MQKQKRERETKRHTVYTGDGSSFSETFGKGMNYIYVLDERTALEAQNLTRRGSLYFRKR